MQRDRIGTRAGWLCGLMMVGVALPAFAKTGTAIRFQVIDAQGQLAHDASVRILGGANKSGSPLFRLDKQTWLIKNPAPKVVLDVRNGRVGGTVELALPGGDDVIAATFFVRVSSTGAVAELVSTSLERPKPTTKEPPTFLPTRSGQTAARQGPPVNDDCANAAVIAIGGTATGSTVTATADNAATCGTSNSGPGVWYKVVGDGTSITASLCGSDFDTKISVFCNNCGDMICVGGGDDTGSCSPQSETTWCSESGTEYFILIHGFLGATGNYTLNVTSNLTACTTPPVCVRNPPPANDDCAAAEPIAVGGTASGATNDATPDAAPFCGISDTAPGVWYSVIGDGTTLTASLCGSSFDTKLTVYCNSCADPLCVDGSDDLGSCSPQSEVTWCTEAGREYLILVHGFSSSVGSFTLNVTSDATACANPPSCAPPTGACCQAGACTVTNLETDCIALGGTWFVGQVCPTFACPAACAGDDCTTPAVVTTVPFSATGNSCTCADDFDEICPFDNPTSPDAVYAYTPTVNECVDISLCSGSAYDTKLYVYENVCGGFQSGTAFACNDDACTTPNFTAGPFVSELTNLQLTAGNTYFIVVDGFDGDCGDYTIDITPCAPACDVVCDKTLGVPENEAICFDGYDDLTNGGCNSLIPAFTNVVCGDTVCATSGTFLGELPCTSDLDCPASCDLAQGICTGGPFQLRDTDWYKITLASEQEITFIVEAEFPVLAGIIDTGGVDSCVGVSAFVDSITGAECDPVSVTHCLGAGTWYLFVAPQDFTGVTCGLEYQADIICNNCPLGACCQPDGSCVADQTEPSCVLGGGTWLGAGSTCTPNVCPQPAPNDDCAGAVSVGVPSTTPGTTDGATTDLGFPTCDTAPVDSPGVWYEVTGTGNTMTASLCNGVAAHDTKISVFCPSCTDAVCVAGNDDFCGLQSEVSWCSQLGQAYQILVHGFGGATGPFELVVTDDGTTCPNPVSCSLCPGEGDCCLAGGNGTPSCSDDTCCNLVCACDPFCCQVEWDADCVDGSLGFGVPGCNAAALCTLCLPPPPTGGCCEGLTCSIQTEADCAALSGSYLGDGSTCDPDGAGTPVVFEEDVNLNIPDNGTPANPLTRTLTVPNSFTVGDVDVDLIVTHSFVGDLIVTLEHNATIATIVDRPGPGSFGCSSNDYNVILDDEGTGGSIEDLCGPTTDDLTPSSPPNYGPANPLNVFDGMDAAGDWILSVSDNADFDTGTLDHWSLHIDLPGFSPCIPTGACCIWPDACSVGTQQACETNGGVYLGDDTSCDSFGPISVFSATVNQDIPDNGTPTNPVSNTITVPDTFTVADADVDLVVTHTWVGDLIVTVTHNATSVTVVDRMGIPVSTFGCNSNDLDIVLDDEGSGGAVNDLCGPSDADLTPPSPPNYTPENPLSAFDGMDAAGDWTIDVSDNADFDTGTFVSWSLHLTAPGPDPCDGVFTGACCDGLTGVCTDNVHSQDCTGFQQVWSKAQLCANVTCVAAIGACCDRNAGQCTEAVTQAQCAGPGQNWLKGGTCDQIVPACESPIIPTVSAWGLVVMVLLLLIAGKVYFGYRRFDVNGGR